MDVSDQFKQMPVCCNKYRFVLAPEKVGRVLSGMRYGDERKRTDDNV